MSELAQLLRSAADAPTADALTAFLQRQPDTLDVPTELQPLLLHAQLTDWLRAHESGARHSSTRKSHVLSLVHWGGESADAAAPTAQHLTPAQLIRLMYGVSQLHDERLQREFETTLVELKRQLALDRFAHGPPLDELDAWVRALFFLAMPRGAEGATSAPFTSSALAQLGSAWQHAPSADAAGEEEEIASELQSLLDCGAQEEVVLDYLAKYKLAEFIALALQWSTLARQQWIDAHPQPQSSAPMATAATAAPAITPAAVAGSSQPRAKTTAAVAPAPAPSVDAPTSPAAAPAVASSWRWDWLELSTLEVEDLLPASLSASYPVSSELRASLQHELADADLADDEQREAWIAKRAMFQAIHEQTLHDIRAFKQQLQPKQQSAQQASAAVADGRRKKPKRKETSIQRTAARADSAAMVGAAGAPVPAASSAAPASSLLGAAGRASSALASQRHRSRFIETSADLMLTQQPVLSDDDDDAEDDDAEAGLSHSHEDRARAPMSHALKRKASASQRARAAASLALTTPPKSTTNNRQSIPVHFEPHQARRSPSPAGKRQKR